MPNEVRFSEKKKKKKKKHEKSGSTCAPIPEMRPMVSSQAQHHDANGPHRGPAKWAVQK